MLDPSFPPDPSFPDGEKSVRRKGITQEEITQLAEVLALNGGSVPDAARTLGWDERRAYNIFYKRQQLAERFAPRNDPDDITLKPNDEIAREPILSPTEHALVERQAKEEKLMKAGDYKSLGLDETQVTQLVSLEKFAGITLAQSIRIAHGGQNKVMLGLLDMFDKFKGKLDSGTWPYTVTPAGDQVLDEAKGVGVLTNISAEIRAVYGQLHKNQVLMLRAAELKGEKGGPNRGKPGFSPGAPPSQTTNIQINGVKDVKVVKPDVQS